MIIGFYHAERRGYHAAAYVAVQHVRDASVSGRNISSCETLAP
jgi:hypothetical protein